MDVVSVNQLEQVNGWRGETDTLDKMEKRINQPIVIQTGDWMMDINN